MANAANRHRRARSTVPIIRATFRQRVLPSPSRQLDRRFPLLVGQRGFQVVWPSNRSACLVVAQPRLLTAIAERYWLHFPSSIEQRNALFPEFRLALHHSIIPISNISKPSHRLPCQTRGVHSLLGTTPPYRAEDIMINIIMINTWPSSTTQECETPLRLRPQTTTHHEDGIIAMSAYRRTGRPARILVPLPTVAADMRRHQRNGCPGARA